MDPSEHWERSENANGIPYYMNHVTQQTSWNHPLINNLEKSLGTFNKIKYAAYRTASKLRAIQKAICSCSLEISTLIEFFEMQNLDKSSSPKETITPKRLEQTLRQLCLHQAKKSSNFTKDPLLAAELLLNWILNIHDRSRKGILRLLSVKISLIIVCNGSQRQKYYYIFSQMQNELGCMNREILGFFLQSCLKIPKYLGEEFYFGRSSIEPAIENFFDQAIDAYEAMGSDFVNWMLAEPQPLVWIPTLYRLAASETTKHEAKCNICKLFPVIGFRYKCLQCFNFDLCQECFWTGRVTKTHKFNHPIQEYCLTSSRGSDIKDVQKMFKNKVLKALSRKKRKESKKRFTEIQPDQQSVKSSNRDYEDDVYSEPSNYQAASEYGEDANDAGIQNNKSSDAQDGGLNSWDPNQQPLSRSKSQDSLPASSVDHDNNEYSSLQRENTLDGEAKLIASPLSKDQKREMERLLTALENDNRQLKNEIETIRGDNESRESEKSGLIQNNTRLRLEKRRMEERQGMLEEHNRQLELQMQKLRLLLQQQKEDLLTMIDLKSTEKSPEYTSIDKPLPNQRSHTNVQNQKELSSMTSYQRGHHTTPVEPYAITDLRQSQASNAMKHIRIPTLISFKKAKINPVYEAIANRDEMERNMRPVERRTKAAWIDSKEESFDSYHHLQRNHDYGHEHELDVSGYLHLLPRDLNMVQKSDRTVDNSHDYDLMTSPRLNLFPEQSKSPEEQELERTVQWAVNSFHISDTDSAC